MSYSFQKIADDWSTLSDTAKHDALEGTKYLKATVSELQALGKFKIISDDKISAKVHGVPKTQLVTPKKLIKTSSFEHLNSVTIAGNTSGNGDIKVAVTTDLTTYYVWDKVNLAWTPITTSNIATGGMTIADVSALTTTEWDALIGYDIGDGVAFAYSLDIDSTSDVAEVDQLTINVDMKGSWNKAVYGTDYTYGYPSNDTLKVKLLTDGDYKINYVQ